jgi:hypothetical protein
MKNLTLFLAVSCAVFLTAVGCSKADKTPPAPEVNGVTVDIPKLSEAFANSSQEVRTTVTQVGFNVRYTKYEDALMSLDKLLSDPATTEDQKKIVNQVIDQVKKLASSAPAPAQ